MKLSEYRGEDALDILAEIIEPAAEIFGDKEFARIYRGGKPIKAVQYVLKKHKTAVLHLMAALDGEDPATYKPGILTLPRQILDLLNDPELVRLFSSQEQSKEKTSSGPATENTEANENE